MVGEKLYEFTRDFYPNDLGSIIIEYVEQLKEENNKLKQLINK